MRRHAITTLVLFAYLSDAHADPGESTDVELTAEEKALVEAALAEGETIEITGVKPVDTAAPGTEDVSGGELHSMAGSRGDAISAVRNLPGIANVDAYDGGGVLAIRGTSGEDSIVLVDGIAVPLAMHFGNVQSILPTEMIERIELLPGGFDVEHGRATGGVLSIVTRQSYPEKWTGHTELSFINAGGFVAGPISKAENITMAASFRRSIIDALLPAILPEDSPVSFRTPPRYYDGQLKLGWMPTPGQEFTLLVFGSDDRTALEVDGVDPLDPVITGDIKGRESFWRTAIRWRLEHEKLTNEATFSYGRDHREQTLGGDQLFYRLTPEILYARNALSYQANRFVRLRAGGDVELVRGRIAAHITLPSGEGADDPILAGDPLIDYDEQTNDTRAAGWIAADIRPQKFLTVTPQLRLDRFDRNGATILQPRLSASVTASSRVTLRGAMGAYTRPLILAEQLRDDLNPERALHFTAGGETKIADGVTVSATAFVTKLDDVVVRDNDFMGQDALDAYSNSATGRVIGGELLIRMQRENLSGWLAYTASKSTRTDRPGMDARVFDYDQPHNLTALASYSLGRWRFGGRFRLSSGTPWTPVVGSVYDSDGNFYRPTHGARNSERTELDHQLDLRIDRRFKIGDLDLDAFLDVSNVYSHPKHLGYDYSFDYSERSKVTDIPIFPALGLRGTL